MTNHTNEKRTFDKSHNQMLRLVISHTHTHTHTEKERKRRDTYKRRGRHSGWKKWAPVLAAAHSLSSHGCSCYRTVKRGEETSSDDKWRKKE